MSYNVEVRLHTKGYPNPWYAVQAPESGYCIKGGRLSGLLARLALVFISSTTLAPPSEESLDEPYIPLV
jgi:hypothetical protein